jgi:hypothetical protein
MRWGAALAPLGLFLAIALCLFAPAWVSPGDRIVGKTGGDDGLFLWFLRWVPYAIAHGQNPLVSDYLDYPAGINLMWNTSLPLVGLVLAPVTLLFGPAVSYNLLSILAPSLSAWCAAIAIRRYVRAPAAVLLGGLLYGFSFLHAQGHLQVTLAFLPPLMFLALDEILVRQKRPAGQMGGALGLLGALQLLIGEELLATAAVVAALGTCLLVALFPGRASARRAYALRAFATAAATFVLVAAVPLAVQFLGPQRVVGTIQPQNVYVNDLAAFVVPTGAQLLAPAEALHVSDRFTGDPSEWDAYLGLPLIVLLSYICARCWRSRVVRLAALLLILLALLSMGPLVHVGGHVTAVPVAIVALVFPLLRHALPARVMMYALFVAWLGLSLLPVLTNILPARLMLYGFLLTGLLLAVWVDSLMRAAGRWRRAAAGLALLAALVPLLPRLPVPVSAVRVPPFFITAAVQQVPQGSVALIAPYAHAGHATAMTWQAYADMRFRMPEGYAVVPGPSTNPPPTALGTLMVGIEEGASPDVGEALGRQLLADLAGWKVETVIVGPMPHQDEMLRLFTGLLGRPPTPVGGVYLWSGSSRSERSWQDAPGYGLRLEPGT